MTMSLASTCLLITPIKDESQRDKVTEQSYGNKELAGEFFTLCITIF